MTLVQIVFVHLKIFFLLELYVYFKILGASSDFDNATKIAKRMVTKFGMSEKVIANFNLPSCITWWCEECSVSERGFYYKLIDFPVSFQMDLTKLTL